MKYPSKKALETYFYDSQLRDYIVQFMAIFSGLQVSVGDNDFEKQSKLIDVPVRYGSLDRVVAAIKSDNTQNKSIRVPTMSAYLVGLEMAPELRKGVGATERYSHFQRGGVFPRDVKVVEQYQPIPYNAVFELNILSSNTDQHFQILEQILTLFDPILQIQVSDDPHDRKRVTTVELTNIGLLENFPVGTDSRIITSKLSFVVPIHLAPPANIRKNVIHNIRLRIEAAMGNQDTKELVSDVTREFPPYQTIFDSKNFDYE